MGREGHRARSAQEGCPATAEEIQQHCRQSIAGFKVPEEVSFVEALPISPTGKILKRVLRDALWQREGRTVG
jgi:acyl-CoA synthetase (AMP-forming)/AMP-acid ligase II